MSVHADLPSEIENLSRALGAAELAGLLSVHRATIFRWAVTGKLKHFRIGPHCIRFDCREVARFLRERAQ